MSVAEPVWRRPAAPERFAETPSPRRPRRGEQARRARRRQQAARRDVAVGAIVALVALVVGPGLGILALVAVLTLAGCATWMLLARRRAAGRRRR